MSRAAALVLVGALLTSVLSGCNADWENMHPGALPKNSNYNSDTDHTPAPNATGSPQDQQRSAWRLTGTPTASVDTKWGGATIGVGFAVYRQLFSQSRTQNVCVSPAELTWMLSGAATAMEKETRNQVLAVMDLQDVPDEWRHALNHDAILIYQQQGALKFSSAGSVWLREGMKPSETFTTTMAEWYGTEIRTMDKPDPAAKQILSWFKEEVGGTSTNRISSRRLLDKPTMALAGFASLEGGWNGYFLRKNTVTAEFTTAMGRNVRVPMMESVGEIMYYDGEDGQAVWLPMTEGRFGLTLMLPKTSRKDLLGEMDIGTLRTMWRNMEARQVVLNLPRFTINARVDLYDVMRKVGMERMLDDSKAEMSPVGKKAFVTGVWHEATLTVDETQTTGGQPLTENPSLLLAEMNINRPFFFAVDDRESGAILMMGVVCDPRLSDS